MVVVVFVVVVVMVVLVVIMVVVVVNRGSLPGRDERDRGLSNFDASNLHYPMIMITKL